MLCDYLENRLDLSRFFFRPGAVLHFEQRLYGFFLSPSIALSFLWWGLMLSLEHWHICRLLDRILKHWGDRSWHVSELRVRLHQAVRMAGLLVIIQQ